MHMETGGTVQCIGLHLIKFWKQNVSAVKREKKAAIDSNSSDWLLGMWPF